MKCQEPVTCHMCCITDQWTDDTCALCGHAEHVPTIPCVDMSQLMWCADMQVKVWVSLPSVHLSLPRLHHQLPPLCSPLEQHNQRSHSDLTKIMTTHSLSSATNLLPHMGLGLTLISVIATYDSISLLRLELVPRTKDLRSYKRCKLKSFYDEISTCTAINSSFTQTRTAQ